MIKLYQRQYNRSQLVRRVGDISQIAGTKEYQLTTGKQKGISAVDFRTGIGFNFTVLPDRGLDISYAEFQGIPLCWRSSADDPTYSDPEESEWLRGFSGGLLTTCGMTQIGGDANQDRDLHGSIADLPAQNVWVDSRWEGDRYIMWSQGKISETVALGSNLSRTRRIWTELGAKKLHIEDLIENVGYKETPLMYLFHVNAGFPIVDEGAELISNSETVTPRDDHSAKGIENYNKCEPPTVDFTEQVFYHEMRSDNKNHVYVAVVNRSFNGGHGLGLYVRYHKTQLPKFIQWKMLSEGSYVIGLEPANCWVEGREKERDLGTLEHIEPGGRRHYEVEIGVLDSNRAIDRFLEKLP